MNHYYFLDTGFFLHLLHVGRKHMVCTDNLHLFFNSVATPGRILNVLSGDAFNYQNIGALSGFDQTFRVVAVSTTTPSKAVLGVPKTAFLLPKFTI